MSIDITMSTETYNFWNIVLQFVIGVAILGTFIVYYRMLQAMRKGAATQNTLSIINLLQDPEVRSARGVVIKKLSEKGYSYWSIDEKNTASLVCSNYDILSILLFTNQFVDNKIFIDNWGPSIITCYEILEPHIKELQKGHGEKYLNDFGVLYTECKKYHALSKV